MIRIHKIVDYHSCRMKCDKCNYLKIFSTILFEGVVETIEAIYFYDEKMIKDQLKMIEWINYASIIYTSINI